MRNFFHLLIFYNSLNFCLFGFVTIFALRQAQGAKIPPKPIPYFYFIHGLKPVAINISPRAAPPSPSRSFGGTNQSCDDTQMGLLIIILR